MAFPVRAERRALTASIAGVIGPLVALGFCLGLGSAPEKRGKLLCFVLPITLAAGLGGLRPGLAATAVSAALGGYALLMPGAAADLALLVAAGVSISVLGAWMHRARERVAALEELLADASGDVAGRRDEEALRKNAAQFHALAASPTIGVVAWNAAGEMAEMNDTFLAMIGYTRDDLRETGGVLSWQELTPPEYGALDQNALQQLAETGVCTPYKKEYLRKDGSRVPILLAGAVLLDHAAFSGMGYVIDLSQLDKAERELRENDRRLRLALEAAQAGTWDIDLGTGTVQVSPSTDQLFGLDPGAGRHPMAAYVARVHPDDGARVAEAIGLSAEGGKPHFVEYRILLDGGAERWVASRGEPVMGPSGEPVRLVGAIMDITERKRAEAALAEAREAAQRQLAELDATYATAPIGLCVIDTELRFVRMNERLAEINGVPAAAHLGKTLREIVPGIADEAEPMLRRVVETGEPLLDLEISGETQAQPGVRRTWVESWFPLRDEGGKILGINIVCEEVTERKRQESAIRAATEAAERSVAQLEAVIGSLHEGLVITAPDGATLTMNERAVRMCGFADLEEARGAAGLFELYTLDGEPLPPEAWPIARVARGEQVESVEVRTRRRDTGGEWIISYAGGPVRDQEGRRIAGVITCQDITAQKRAVGEREVLLASERAARAEAERANRMKDEFLAVVSHELRTPLNAILGWASLLRRPSRTADQIDKGLAVVERNTRLLVQLIADLLDVSRIISGKIHLDLQPTKLSACAEAAVDALRSAAAEKDIALHEAIAPIDDGAVQGDPARLQQIAMNLLSNAIKFTPRGGRVEVSVTPSGDRAEIVVRDTGQGIAPEFLPYVFDRFRQADASTTRQHGGLGLGLAIVRSLVDLHGGSVIVESAGLNRGATFTVSLPCSAARIGVEAAPLSDEATSLRGVRALVVDDERDTRELVERVLAEHGAAAIAAASAEEALSLLQGCTVDVVVSDIGMPGMDGYAFIQKVRGGSAEAARGVPALALTAFARPEDRDRALAAGYQAHVTKPIDPTELVTAVASLRHGLGARRAAVQPTEPNAA